VDHLERMKDAKAITEVPQTVANTHLIRETSVYMVSSRKNARLFATAVVAVVAALTMGVGPSDSPLVFVDEEPLAATWKQVKVGEEVVVCNLGEDQLQDLRARIIGFNFPDESEDALKSPEGSNFQNTLKTEQCTTARVKTKGGAELEPGEYKGGLVVSAEGVEKITRNIVIQVPKPTVKGVVDNTVLTSRRWLGLLSDKSTENFRLDLRLEGEGDLPSDLYPQTNAGDKAIGVVTSGDSPAFLYVNGQPDYSRRDDGIVALPVQARELNKVGTYAGSLRESGNAVKLELRVTHPFYWALGAILLGTLISLALLFWRQHWNPRSELKRRCRSLIQDYRTANGHFRKWFENYRNHRLEGHQQYTPVTSIGEYEPDEESIRTYQGEFWREVQRYARDNIFFNTASDDFKKLVKTLETAESDAKHLGEQTGRDGRSGSRFGESLRILGAALESFDKFLKNEWGEDRTPALVKPAANLLDGGQLAVGAVQKISTQAKDHATLIENWRKMAVEVKRYTLWYIRLRPTQGLSQRHRGMLERAGARIIEAKQEMMEAKDGATLAELGAATDLKRAYGTLAFLGSLYGVWEAPEKEKEREEREEGAKAMMLLSKEDERITSFAPLYADPNRHLDAKLPEEPKFEEWMEKARHVPVAPADVPRVERNKRWIVNATVLGVILLVGILALLFPIYSDKPWGTGRDYVAAVVLGAGAPLAVQLSDTVKQLWERLRS
jgi:hypothetical protein